MSLTLFSAKLLSSNVDCSVSSSITAVSFFLQLLIVIKLISNKKMNNFEKNVDFINFFLKVNNTFEYKYTKRFNRLKIMIV